MGSAKIQGPLWSAESADWAGQELRHEPLFNTMLDAVNIANGMRVLDIGCGTGYSSHLIAKRGADVIGVDAAQGLIDFGRERHGDLDLQTGDMEELAFDDNSFDLVFAANSIQYGTDLANVLCELKRVCKDGGCVIAGLFGPPEGVAYKTVLAAAGQFMPPPPDGKPGGPFRLSQPGVLENGFTEAGLTVVDSGKVNCPFSYDEWDEFWRITKSAGPFQMVIGMAGLAEVEAATKKAVSGFIAQV